MSETGVGCQAKEEGRGRDWPNGDVWEVGSEGRGWGYELLNDDVWEVSSEEAGGRMTEW